MSKALSHLKAWAPVGLSVAAFGIAGGLVLSRQSRAAESVRKVAALGNSISALASQVTQGALSPRDAAELEANRAYLEQRLDNCQKVGLVHNGITETVRDCGARVREIKRVTTPFALGGGPISPFPRFHVAIDGTYRQIATFMNECGKAVLPVRVVGFAVSRADVQMAGVGTLLRADITVESFVPASQSASKEGDA